ncbi:hypothetical protein C6W27_08990 [Bacillus paralicheniformis]|uniref:hypothetical protein n=1 Tax=Bacillus paralicheniformis TaxID=1648923 RepID=UPI000D031445|nr:hypothetical protein [Bacillus paralicheniformis]PRS16526.1 hypothetical protein C6W27_08990 [Bacillus paralicheniformis]
MKLFENEKLKKVNERLSELTEKRESLQNEVNEILQAVEDSVQSYALGEVSEEDVQKAEQLLQEKTEEIKKTDEMIQRVQSIRKSVAVESIPLVKEQRRKKVEKIQSKYDKKAAEVIEARNEFLRKLGELGDMKKEVGNVNNEFNSVMVELGENPSAYGAALNEHLVIFERNVTKEADCLGLTEQIQKATYKSGNVPNFAKDGES